MMMISRIQIAVVGLHFTPWFYLWVFGS